MWLLKNKGSLLIKNPHHCIHHLQLSLLKFSGAHPIVVSGGNVLSFFFFESLHAYSKEAYKIDVFKILLIMIWSHMHRYKMI